MFTGIIIAQGRIAATEAVAGDLRMSIVSEHAFIGDLEMGDSVAVSGVCLTVTGFLQQGFSADLSRETLALTTLGDKAVGDQLNLEPALRAGDRLGGHWVSGHVDGMATLLECWPEARSQRMRIRVPDELSRYVAAKGSVCLDGVSLTVNQVAGREFEVNIVPHTLTHTTLGSAEAGDCMNMEVDILARYLERLLQQREAGSNGTEGP